MKDFAQPGISKSQLKISFIKHLKLQGLGVYLCQPQNTVEQNVF